MIHKFIGVIPIDITYGNSFSNLRTLMNVGQISVAVYLDLAKFDIFTGSIIFFDAH